eukprot:145358_1
MAGSLNAFLQQEEQRTRQLYSEWADACKSNNHERIKSYFDLHHQDFFSSEKPTLFLENLIENDDIESIKYILQHHNTKKYINLPSYPLRIACNFSTFEMVRLFVSNGAIFDNQIGGGTVLSYLLESKRMTGDEIYLCAEYLLTKLDGELHCNAGGNLIMRLAWYTKNPSWNRLKMVKLIKSKRPNFTIKGYIRSVVSNKHFELAEYLLKNGEELQPAFFVTTEVEVIKWLLKHNVDINGNCGSCKYSPLFQACISKQYAIMETLINNGADLNKQCTYKSQTLTALEYCKDHFAPKYYEYFQKYERQTDDNIFFDVDLSKIPTVAYEPKVSFDDSRLLNDITDQYMKKKKEINDIETELTSKYEELKSLCNQQTRLTNTKNHIDRWNNAMNSRSEWTKFLRHWKKWNIVCFVEYLKRTKYAEKSYNEYYSSDKDCKEKIEKYIKNNVNKFKANNDEEKKESMNDDTSYFKGAYLPIFDISSINGIGITSKPDTEIVYSFLQKLIQTEKANETTEQKRSHQKDDNIVSKEQKMMIHWLRDIVKLPQYIDVFVANDFNLEIMELVQKDDLKQIGIMSVGHQIKIIQYAKRLKQQNEGGVPTTYI